MPNITNLNEYHSHNTSILGLEGMKKLLLKLPIIRKDILGEVDAIQYPY
jgi:UDP-glucose 4-epimerase